MSMMFENILGPHRPLTWLIQFWPVPVLSLVSAFASTWLCQRLAIKLGIVDMPDKVVKTHREPVAYMGGLAIFIGLAAGVLAAVYCLRDIPDFQGILKWLCGLLAGGAVALFLGLVDDVISLRPWQKIVGQLAAGGVLLLVGIHPTLRYFTDMIGWEISDRLEMLLGIPIVIIFVLGATNSLNLLDGLDGLCAGVTAIITGAMLLLAVHLATWRFSEVGDPVRVVLCLALAGSVCGFLPFNRNPAKIFMGDAGSMLLGFEMAALMILFAEKIPRWWLASIVIFGLPILDTFVAVLRRIVNRRPIFQSDRGHIYDQLMDRGMSLKQAVRTCYIMAAGYATVGLVMSQMRMKYALIVYALVVYDSIDTVCRKGFLKMSGIRGTSDKPNVIYRGHRDRAQGTP